MRTRFASPLFRVLHLAPRISFKTRVQAAVGMTRNMHAWVSRGVVESSAKGVEAEAHAARRRRFCLYYLLVVVHSGQRREILVRYICRAVSLMAVVPERIARRQTLWVIGTWWRALPVDTELQIPTGMPKAWGEKKFASG